MRIPTIQGVIRRRLLVNFRVDPDVIARQLPEGFEPKLYGGYAVAGICLIRLERIRPFFVPLPVGFGSENAAHRVAVRTVRAEDAVFVPRRDSDSRINHFLGSRVFPGRYHRARFEVSDDLDRVELSMRSLDKEVSLHVSGKTAPSLPETSIFRSLDRASRFFEVGSLGYSATSDPRRFDAMVLDTKEWSVTALSVDSVSSSWFEDERRFPAGSVAFDHALVMRNLQHAWRTATDLVVEEPAGQCV